MAEQLAENYHNTWGRKKKLELQAKGKSVSLQRTVARFKGHLGLPLYWHWVELFLFMKLQLYSLENVKVSTLG